jgi:Winged helix DNA-binding domain
VSRPSILAERLTAQLLGGPPAGAVVDVVARLLAVQAQDPRGARLAIRARSVGLSAADIDRALTVDRSVVITTVNRGTLHMVRSDDYWWLHQLTTPQLATASARRLAQEGVTPRDADRGVAIIEAALTDNGPLTRSRLRAPIAAAGIRVEGQALVHILLLATLRGLIVRGPMLDGDHAFVLVRDWLGSAPPPRTREVALGELAYRYLVGHGPADDSDLAKWAGITLGDARRGLTAISARLIDRDDGLAAVVDRTDHAALPPPRMLGSFDPSLLGWKSRESITGSHQGIVTTNGIFRPFAMVDGRAVATWTLANGQIALMPFDRLTRAASVALDADAAAVVEFLRAPSSGHDGGIPKRSRSLT